MRPAASLLESDQPARLTPDRTQRRRGRAMGSDLHVIVTDGPAGAADRALARINALEQLWSRFIPTSDISRLNRSQGTWTDVNEATVTLLQHAVEAWRLTGGTFDPTVLGDLVRAGYEDSREPGAAPALTAESAVRPYRSLLLGCTDLQFRSGQVLVPEGVGVDAGGIGKGLAADLVAEQLRAEGVAGACVNLGGDLRVFGDAPGGGPWTVDVCHEWSDEPVATLQLLDGAVATSTTLRRAWFQDGVLKHHLIDPGTGLPADTDLSQVTVLAAHAWAAEVLAKALLIRGAAHPFDLLGGTNVQAIVIDDQGRAASTAGADPFLQDGLLRDVEAPR